MFAQVVSTLFSSATLQHSQRLLGGVSADVYRLDLVNTHGQPNSVVVRVHGATHGGHDAQLEYDLLQALHDLGVPVPRPLAVDVSGALLPHPFLVIAFVEGTSGVPDTLGEHCVHAMAEMLARIHRPVPSGFPELPVRTNPLPELFDFFPEGQEWQPLHDHLRTLQDTAYHGPHQLLHGDFWPENLLWQGPQIAAVLDWEDAAVGDPHADVAGVQVELRYLFGQPVMERFLQAYAGTQALDRRRLALWQIYVAAAADRYVDEWDLPAERLARMHREARASIREAGALLLGS